MSRRLLNKSDVHKALAQIIERRAVFEVRALDAQLYGNRRTGTVSGYFDNADACLSELEKLTAAKGIYFTLNPVNGALLARRANRLDYAEKNATTNDQHILQRRWLLLDVDADRPSGISASDSEKEAAHKKAREIYDYLTGRGWPLPMAADSGNGYHLLYRIDLPCDDGKVLEQVLTVLADHFDGDGVKLDRSVHNKARIARLYGTVAAKGDNTKERPHRLSKILSVPDPLQVVSFEQLRVLVDELKPAEPPPAARRAGFDVEEFLTRHGIAVTERSTLPDGRIRWRLERCPFNPDHETPDASVFLRPDGVLGFKCFHTSCVDKHWKQFRRHFDPDYDYGKAEFARPDTGPRAANREPLELPPPPPPYVPPPLDLFPDKVQRFIRAGAATFDVDRAFFLLPVLSGGAAMIGNSRSIRLKEDYVEPSIIWTATIAPTGDGKSPVLQAATAPVRMREIGLIKKNKDADKTFEGDFANWEAKTKKERAGDKKPEKPAVLTCWLDDATTEAAALRLRDNPRGVLLPKDEFSHWFESMDQYHDRGGADVSRWLSIWTGHLFALDRVSGNRSYRITNPRLSITGGIVPHKYEDLLTDDFFVRGLPARFLFAMPTRNQPRKWVDKDIPKEVKAAVNELFARLAELPPHKDEEHDEESPVLLGLTPEAKEIFVDFYNECARRAFEANVREAAQWSKLSAYSARLALVGQLMRDPDAEIVTGETMQAACDLARWFGIEAERIYALIAETPEQREQRKLVEFIERHGMKVTVREVTQLFRPLKNNRDEAERQLNALVRAGYGEWTETKGARGPATREFHLLHVSTSTGFEDSPSIKQELVDVDSPNSQTNEGPAESDGQKNTISPESDTETDKSQLLQVSTSTDLSNPPSIDQKPVDVDSKSVQNNEAPPTPAGGSPQPTPKKLRL